MLSILRKARMKDKEMRILMLCVLEDAVQIEHMQGLLIILKVFVWTDSLGIGDVGGQKTLRSYWKNYFEKTDALIWVVDATDRLRIDDCREELAGLLLEERLMGASLLIFANKTDIAGCMEEDEIRVGLQLDAIRTHNWTIIQCSALTGSNLNEGLQWVVRDAKHKLF
ncbi:MAG: ADP-ribosylation factor-like protein 2 [Vezdaea acicularis]|nr:MAG: ADP-ribosylation factor-like protein 2 [Vezdaea acicularis]